MNEKSPRGDVVEERAWLALKAHAIQQIRLAREVLQSERMPETDENILGVAQILATNRVAEKLR